VLPGRFRPLVFCPVRSPPISGQSSLTSTLVIGFACGHSRFPTRVVACRHPDVERSASFVTARLGASGATQRPHPDPRGLDANWRCACDSAFIPAGPSPPTIVSRGRRSLLRALALPPRTPEWGAKAMIAEGRENLRQSRRGWPFLPGPGLMFLTCWDVQTSWAKTAGRALTETPPGKRDEGGTPVPRTVAGGRGAYRSTCRTRAAPCGRSTMSISGWRRRHIGGSWGESGCGKTMLVGAGQKTKILQLCQAASSGGRVMFRRPATSAGRCPRRSHAARLRGPELAVVFQGPQTSAHPVLNLRHQARRDAASPSWQWDWWCGDRARHRGCWRLWQSPPHTGTQRMRQLSATSFRGHARRVRDCHRAFP